MLLRPPRLEALLVFLVACLASPVRADVPVTMVGFEFSPRDIVIDVGDTVTWSNPEGMFHSVTDGAGAADPEAGFRFDTYFLGDPEQTFAYTFPDSGTFLYFCRFHEALAMTGTVTVKGPAGTGVGSSVAPTDLHAMPNPARDGTTLAFALPHSMEVRADVYDLAGRRVRELFRGRLAKGIQTLQWNGRDQRSVDVPSGVYVMRLEAPGASSSIRVTLLR